MFRSMAEKKVRAAGYDPVAGVSLFRFLSAGSDHPHRAERLAAVLAVGCWMNHRSGKVARPVEASDGGKQAVLID